MSNRLWITELWVIVQCVSNLWASRVSKFFQKKAHKLERAHKLVKSEILVKRHLKVEKWMNLGLEKANFGLFLVQFNIIGQLRTETYVIN